MTINCISSFHNLINPPDSAFIDEEVLLYDFYEQETYKNTGQVQESTTTEQIFLFNQRVKSSNKEELFPIYELWDGPEIFKDYLNSKDRSS